MQNIFKAIAFIVNCSLLLVNCTSDPLEGRGSYTSSVSVVSQDVCFKAKASQGTIVFSAPGAATVSVTSDWCKASLDGTTINVTASQNNTRNSRSCDVIIKCGADSAKVNVIQEGYIFSLSAGNTVVMDADEAQTVKYGYTDDLGFTLKSSADWFTAAVEGDSVTLTFKENATGHMRKGYMYYIAGDACDSIPVIQYDYAKDVAGPATLCYKNKDGIDCQTPIILTDSGFTLPEYEAEYGVLNVPFTFDAAKMKFNFTNAQDVGQYNVTVNNSTATYYVSDIIFGGGYYSTYKSISWDAYMTYSNEKRCMEAAMVDNGSWTYAAFEGFYLRKFISKTYSGSTDGGSLEMFNSPKIIRNN